MKVVQCRRVADLEDPVAGSVVLHCTACSVPIWFYAGDLDAGAVVLYCEECVPDVGPIMFTPGQIVILRSRGLDDDAIARLLAIARLTHGDPRGVRALAELVAADPGAARRFDEAIATAAADLAETGVLPVNRLEPPPPGHARS
jgi:hypothetical protein